MKFRYLILLCFSLFACQIDEGESPDYGVATQELTNPTFTPDVNKAGTPTPVGNLETMSAPGGLVVGAAVTGTSTSVGVYSLTDTGKSNPVNRYVGYHLVDVYGTRWPITANTATVYTLGTPETPTYPPPNTPGPGAYQLTGGGGVYVGQTLPGTATGGICASEIGSSCPVGYVRGDHGFFGTGDGNDQDLSVYGCTNIGQLRMLWPYRPGTCNSCGSGTNGCSAGVDCPWNTITQVDGLGDQDDFFPMVQTSNLHINPGTGSTDQLWTGIDDGNDTGRVMVVQNDSDVYTPTTMVFGYEHTGSPNGSDRFRPGFGRFPWKLEPGATLDLLHDDATDPDGAGPGVAGPDAWRFRSWTSTRWPRIKLQRLDAEEESNSVSSCGVGATISKGTSFFTVTAGLTATSCTITFGTVTGNSLYTLRPSCILHSDYGTAMTKTVTASSIVVNSVSGNLGTFDVLCAGHEK